MLTVTIPACRGEPEVEPPATCASVETQRLHVDAEKRIEVCFRADDPFTVAAATSDSGVATVRVVDDGLVEARGVGEGDARVTVTATNEAGEASTGFTVEVVGPPRSCRDLPPLKLLLGGSQGASVCFQSRTDMTVTAVSSDEGVAEVEVLSPDSLRVEALGEGESEITVTATNEAGEVDVGFMVEVAGPPRSCRDLPSLELLLGDSAAVGICFRSRIEMAVTAVSSDEGVAEVEVLSPDSLRVEALGEGESEITVTAANEAGEVSVRFEVDVAGPPVACDSVPPLHVVVGDSVAVGICFRSKIEMAVTASSSDKEVAGVAVRSADSLVVDGRSPGRATITATATNAAGSAEVSFETTVYDTVREVIFDDDFDRDSLGDDWTVWGESSRADIRDGQLRVWPEDISYYGFAARLLGTGVEKWELSGSLRLRRNVTWSSFWVSLDSNDNGEIDDDDAFVHLDLGSSDLHDTISDMRLYHIGAGGGSTILGLAETGFDHGGFVDVALSFEDSSYSVRVGDFEATYEASPEHRMPTIEVALVASIGSKHPTRAEWVALKGSRTIAERELWLDPEYPHWRTRRFLEIRNAPIWRPRP